MNIFDGIRSYINDSDLKITIINNKINIINYDDIGHFNSDKVVVKSKNNSFIIKGNNLVVSKLMNNEILITGDFKGIEFR